MQFFCVCLFLNLMFIFLSGCGNLEKSPAIPWRNTDGFDREGYNKRGFDKNGYDREGYDKFGCNKNKKNRLGLHCEDVINFKKNNMSWAEVLQLRESKKQIEKNSLVDIKNLESENKRTISELKAAHEVENRAQVHRIGELGADNQALIVQNLTYKNELAQKQQQEKWSAEQFSSNYQTINSMRGELNTALQNIVLLSKQRDQLLVDNQNLSDERNNFEQNNQHLTEQHNQLQENYRALAEEQNRVQGENRDILAAQMEHQRINQDLIQQRNQLWGNNNQLLEELNQVKMNREELLRRNQELAEANN
ncbi:MAG: hypothetical protein KC505_08395 [Myxococcales bacterium]|nr:hypothetical protein [Myxococcales bacterium]USN51313.1 MAG: hypothetical protein H6731_02595 [Myxococcales bacterium]